MAFSHINFRTVVELLIFQYFRRANFLRVDVISPEGESPNPKVTHPIYDHEIVEAIYTYIYDQSLNYC